MRHAGLSLLKKASNLYIAVFTILFYSCNSAQENKLPIFGNKDTDEKGDTIYHTIPDFSFVNQFDETVSEQKFKNKIYIADFIFTTCPGICPIMTKQLARVQKAFESEKVKPFLISHTVDPETDSVKVLLEYGKLKGANFSTWDFVTGSKKKIYKIAEQYLVVANEDPNTEIKFVHSETLVLIDKNKRIRGMYNGTDSLEVNKLIIDIKTLMQE